MSQRAFLIVVITSLSSLAGVSAHAMPYGVANWNQRTHDFTSDYQNAPTDLYSGGVQLTYSQLAASADIWRGWSGTAVTGTAYDSVSDPGAANRVDFVNSDYTDITSGDNHCCPTAFAMAHNYWWNNSLNEKATISQFAMAMDTNDINPSMNNGDHQLHYGTFLSNQPLGAKTFSPGFPWTGKYESRLIPAPDTDTVAAQRIPFYGEIRAGRPTKVGVPGHATTGVNFDPANGVVINDPWDGTTHAEPWSRVTNFVTFQPHRLSDLPAGDRLFFSNDNFGTGQANAQAPGGDPGDIFGSSLNGSYGRVLDDATAGIATHTTANPDYNAGTVTSALEYPFDIDAMDVLISVEPMIKLMYSLDHGDPNPHDWIPGVSTGGASYQSQEVMVRALPTSWYTSGIEQRGHASITANENQLGLNRAEWSLPGDPLDDDVDALEVEWDASMFAFSTDYVDTRVFPEYTASVGAHWYELPEYDPTDIYFYSGVGDALLLFDGETDIGLSSGTDIDAIQFFQDTEDAVFSGFLDSIIDGLLFSVDGDAPEHMDMFGNILDPGALYWSRLDGSAPVFFSLITSGDLDAMVFVVPASAPWMLLAIGATGLVTLSRGRGAAKKGTVVNGAGAHGSTDDRLA